MSPWAAQVEADDWIHGAEAKTKRTRRGSCSGLRYGDALEVLRRFEKAMAMHQVFTQTSPALARLPRCHLCFLYFLVSCGSNKQSPNPTQNCLDRDKHPILAWCTPTDAPTLPCACAAVTRQDVASQVRKARELSSHASSIPDFWSGSFGQNDTTPYNSRVFDYGNEPHLKGSN